MFIALNLPILMRGLRNVLIKMRGVKGVAQISPSLISSHITRSTLTFAIFAVILTLNVLVAALIPTSMGTATQLCDHARSSGNTGDIPLDRRRTAARHAKGAVGSLLYYGHILAIQTY